MVRIVDARDAVALVSDKLRGGDVSAGVDAAANSANMVR